MDEDEPTDEELLRRVGDDGEIGAALTLALRKTDQALTFVTDRILSLEQRIEALEER
jgi:hypothetical protein